MTNLGIKQNLDNHPEEAESKATKKWTSKTYKEFFSTCHLFKFLSQTGTMFHAPHVKTSWNS